MVIMQDALPGIKRFLKAAGLGETTERYVTGFIVAFSMHVGRMSATAASSAIRIQPNVCPTVSVDLHRPPRRRHDRKTSGHVEGKMGKPSRSWKNFR